MSNTILSSFNVQMYRSQLTENQRVFQQVLRDGNHANLIQTAQQPCSVSSSQSENILECLRKKYRTNENLEMSRLHEICGIEIISDVKQDQTDYFQREVRSINRNFGRLKQKLIREENRRNEEANRKLQQFKKQVFVWFYQESLRKSPFEMMNEKRSNEVKSLVRKSIMQPTIVVRADQQEGIQVTGTILTREGYSITYPNLLNIIKHTQFQESKEVLILSRPVRVKGVMCNEDQMDDLRQYVWKERQYRSFFRLLLRTSINNREIKNILVKVQEKMKTGFFHVFTFYHISNKSWNLSSLIKDLNKRGLFPRERQEMIDEMVNNINEDLDLIFKAFKTDEEWIPEEETFVSFEQYRMRLQQILLTRN